MHTMWCPSSSSTICFQPSVELSNWRWKADLLLPSCIRHKSSLALETSMPMKVFEVCWVCGKWSMVMIALTHGSSSDLRRNIDPAHATVRVNMSKVVRSRCHLIWYLNKSHADLLTNDLHNLIAQSERINQRLQNQNTRNKNSKIRHEFTKYTH